MKRGVYEMKNQPKKETFKYKQEGRLCIGVAKVESKNGTITGKRCPVFDYTENKIVTIDVYKKEILNEFARIRKLTSLKSMYISKLQKTLYRSKDNNSTYFTFSILFAK